MENPDLENLRALATQDYRSFVQRRKELIDAAIAADPAHSTSLQALQDEIEAARAIAGSPEKALSGLFSQLQGRLENLNLWLERLEAEVRHLKTIAPATEQPVAEAARSGH